MKKLLTTILVLVASTLLACGESKPVASQKPRARLGKVIATTLATGSVLNASSRFSVTGDGHGIISAFFGPRAIARLVTEETPTADFEAADFPEGQADLRLVTGWNETLLGDIRIDKTAPQIIGIRPMNQGSRFLDVRVWDESLHLGELGLELGGVTLTQDLGNVVLTGSKSHTVQLDTTQIPEGSYRPEIRLTDQAGNETRRVADVLVDRTPPVAVFTSPVPAATVSGSLTLFLSVVDNIGPASVEIFAQGSSLGFFSGPEATVTVDLFTFPKGPLALSAVPVDFAGNRGQPVDRKVTIQ